MVDPGWLENCSFQSRLSGHFQIAIGQFFFIILNPDRCSVADISLWYIIAQDAQPRTIIALWKANMEEPNFSQPDPTVIITDSTSSNFSTTWTWCNCCFFVLQNTR